MSLASRVGIDGDFEVDPSRSGGDALLEEHRGVGPSSPEKWPPSRTGRAAKITGSGNAFFERGDRGSHVDVGEVPNGPLACRRHGLS